MLCIYVAKQKMTDQLQSDCAADPNIGFLMMQLIQGLSAISDSHSYLYPCLKHLKFQIEDFFFILFLPYFN